MPVAAGVEAEPAALTMADFGRRWGLSPRSILRLRDAGLPSIKIGRKIVRIEPFSADEWLRKNYGE